MANYQLFLYRKRKVILICLSLNLLGFLCLYVWFEERNSSKYKYDIEYNFSNLDDETVSELQEDHFISYAREEVHRRLNDRVPQFDSSHFELTHKKDKNTISFSTYFPLKADLGDMSLSLQKKNDKVGHQLFLSELSYKLQLHLVPEVPEKKVSNKNKKSSQKKVIAKKPTISEHCKKNIDICTLARYKALGIKKELESETAAHLVFLRSSLMKRYPKLNSSFTNFLISNLENHKLSGIDNFLYTLSSIHNTVADYQQSLEQSISLSPNIVIKQQKLRIGSLIWSEVNPYVLILGPFLTSLVTILLAIGAKYRISSSRFKLEDGIIDSTNS